MPLNLVDLPVDVLDKFFENLLPPLNVFPPLQKDSIPAPVDLHKLMLVSRRLHNTALPWAWRRVAIDICTSEEYLDDERFPFNLENHRDPRLRHATRFAHIRVFALSIHHFGREPDDPAPALKTLKTLKYCVSLMENLQVFVFDSDSAFPALVGDILTSLISKPRLHALSTSNPTPVARSSLASLRRLRTDESSELECISIGSPSDVLTSSIPWPTLRVIHVSGGVVNAIIKGFPTWKQTFPDTCSPLKEISIGTNDMSDSSSDDLGRLFRVFRTQDIHTLSLIQLPSVNGELIDRIVEAFPGVESLTLTAQWSFTWNMSSIDVALGRFPTLRKLKWNFDDAAVAAKGFFFLGVYDPDIRSQKTIPSIAVHCEVLEYVKFFSIMHRDRAYLIHRDRLGRYPRCQLIEGSDIVNR